MIIITVVVIAAVIFSAFTIKQTRVYEPTGAELIQALKSTKGQKS